MTEDLFRHLRVNASVSEDNTNLLEDYVHFVDEVTSDQSKYFGDMVELANSSDLFNKPKHSYTKKLIKKTI